MADPSPYVSRLQCVVHVEGGAATLLSIGKCAAPRCEGSLPHPQGVQGSHLNLSQTSAQRHAMNRLLNNKAAKHVPFPHSSAATRVVCGDAHLTLPPTSQASDPVARPRVRSVDGAAEGEAARRRHRVPRFGRDLAEIRPCGGGDVAETWRRCGACGGEIVESERSVEK